VEINLSEIRLR